MDNKSETLINQKIDLLNSIYKIVLEESENYKNSEKFDILIETENKMIEKLKKIDKMDFKISGKNYDIIKNILNQINSVKKEVIENFNCYIEDFEKNNLLTISNTKNLADSYFQKNAFKPRFINKLK